MDFVLRTLLFTLLMTPLNLDASSLTEMTELKESPAQSTKASPDYLEKANWNRVFNTKIGNILHTANRLEINGMSCGPECTIKYQPTLSHTLKKESKGTLLSPVTLTLSVYSTPAEFEFILKKSGLL